MSNETNTETTEGIAPQAALEAQNTFIDANGVVQPLPAGMRLVASDTPVTDAFAQASTPFGVKLQKRCYEDDPRSEQTYDAIVRFVDGRSFNVDLLSDTDFDSYNSQSQSIGESLRVADAAMVNELFQRRRALIDGLMTSHVKGENGVATKSERRLKMIFTDKVELVEGIAAKSKFGHTDTDFLGQS